MKKTLLGALFIVATLLVSSGCYTAPPEATVQTSPPAVPVPPPTGYVSYAAEYYAWDRAEYVGVSGGNYVLLDRWGLGNGSSYHRSALSWLGEVPSRLA